MSKLTILTAAQIAVLNTANPNNIADMLREIEFGSTLAELIEQANTEVLPPVADLAALKAVVEADLSDGAMIFCEALGLYRWDDTSAAAADDNLVVRPTARATSNGRFLKMAQLTVNHDDLAGIDANNVKHTQHVADLAAVKALAIGACVETKLYFVPTLGVYEYNAGSSAANDDNFVIEPTHGTGRFLKCANLELGHDSLKGIDAAGVKHVNAVFQSAEQTGTGAPQNVAHGLGVVPNLVFALPSTYTAGLASGLAVAYGAHDATNCILTVTSGEKFTVVALRIG